jgi:hypothetical protein
VQDELAKLDADIEARHAQELQQLDAAAAAAAAAAPPAVAAAAGGAAAKQQAAAAANGSAAAADKASKYLVDLSIGDEEPEDAEQKGKVGGHCSSLLSCHNVLYLVVTSVDVLQLIPSVAEEQQENGEHKGKADASDWL